MPSTELPDFGLKPDKLSLLRIASEKVYNTGNGRTFFDALFEDLWLYDMQLPSREAEVLKDFAVKVMQKYFGKMLPGQLSHRSELTAQIMTVATPTVAEET